MADEVPDSAKPVPLKMLSLWQPWATLIALGAKTIETRSWSTPYRGPLAIHAAKRPPDLGALGHGAVANIEGEGRVWMDDGHPDEWAPLPLGAVVAVCDLAVAQPLMPTTLDRLDVLDALQQPSETARTEVTERAVSGHVDAERIVRIEQRQVAVLAEFDASRDVGVVVERTDDRDNVDPVEVV